MAQPTQIERDIDPRELADMVCRALDRPKLQLVDWQVRKMTGGVEADNFIYRFEGIAAAAGETLPWALILKSMAASDKNQNTDGIWYWKREGMAYQSGLLHSLPGGNVTAPACYGVQERPDGSVWLWLEAVQDDVGSPWPLEQYARAARHLGQFNGAYLCGQPLPSDDWITHKWLHKYVEHGSSTIDFIHSHPAHPVARNFLGGLFVPTLAIWDEHRRILDILDGLPQVFCHQDAFKRNLFARREKTIAIDWGYAGIAPVGAELAALVAGSLGLWEVSSAQVMELERQCIDGYLQGLAEAGWTGDPHLVRQGYALTLLMRYPLGGAIGELIPALVDQSTRERVEAVMGKSAEEIEKADPAVEAYYQQAFPVALKMLGMTGLLRFSIRMGMYNLRLGKSKQN